MKSQRWTLGSWGSWLWFCVVVMDGRRVPVSTRWRRRPECVVGFGVWVRFGPDPEPSPGLGPAPWDVDGASWAVELLARRWTLPILGALWPEDRFRRVRLRDGLGGISDRVLTDTLRELVRRGLVSRREVVGVLSQVEYALTERGRSVAEPLRVISAWAGTGAGDVPWDEDAVRRVVELLARRWTLPILGALWPEDRLRRMWLRDGLDGISDRVLTVALRELAGQGLVWRRVVVGVPPQVEYGLTERGRSLGGPLQVISVWAGDA
jgi:DNA-binding HxlR family transcriptional regulator